MHGVKFDDGKICWNDVRAIIPVQFIKISYAREQMQLDAFRFLGSSALGFAIVVLLVIQNSRTIDFDRQ